MKYCIENELNTMDFHDATIEAVDWDDRENVQAVLTFTLTGVIVKAENSQNEMYTDRYADTMNLRFTGAEIQAILLEGHKLYDADDRLIEQVPDRPFSAEEYRQVLKKFANSAIFYAGIPKEKVVENYVNFPGSAAGNTTMGDGSDICKRKECFQMIIDTDEEENPSYVLSFFYDNATASFEHLLNKANIM